MNTKFGLNFFNILIINYTEIKYRRECTKKNKNCPKIVLNLEYL